MYMVILCVKIISWFFFKLNIAINLLLDFCMVLLHLRKHTVLYEKIITFQIFVEVLKLTSLYVTGNHSKESAVIVAAPDYVSRYSHIYWKMNVIFWGISKRDNMSEKDTMR